MDMRIKLLTLLLAVQFVIIILAYSGKAPTGGPDVALLPGMKAEQIRKMIITDNEKQSITLGRDEKGWYAVSGSLGGENGRAKTFRSTDELHYPVDQEKAAELAAKLVGLQSSRVVTSTRSSHDRLQVGEKSFTRRIELINEAGISGVIFLGGAPNYKTIHVRSNGATAVYLVKDLALWEAPAEATSWWPGNYVSFPVDDLQQVTIANRHGKIVLERTDEGQWVLSGSKKAPAAEPVREFFDRIKEITLADIITTPVAKNQKDAIATLTVKVRGKTEILTIWPKEKDAADHVVKSSAREFYGRVGGYEVEHLLNKKEADFLAAR